MDVTAWQLAPKEEKPELFARRLDNFLTFHGPGGFATPDDVEAIESCQAGYKAEGVEWSELSRGMHREAIAEDELRCARSGASGSAICQGWEKSKPTTPINRGDGDQAKAALAR